MAAQRRDAHRAVAVSVSDVAGEQALLRSDALVHVDRHVQVAGRVRKRDQALGPLRVQPVPDRSTCQRAWRGGFAVVEPGVRWFYLYDEAPNPTHNEMDWGLLTSDGAKKPAYFAFKNG